MSSLNKVQIIGNVGKDPEIRTMSSGDKVANVTVATSEKWKDKTTGEKKEKTEWHRVTVWNQGIIGVIEQYLKKGDKVYFEGQLETRKWDKDGVDMYSTEISLRPFRGEMILLSGARSGTVETHHNPPQHPPAVSYTPTAPDGVAIDDDSIPF
jgi:single-strand DNA-binding protein